MEFTKALTFLAVVAVLVSVVAVIIISTIPNKFTKLTGKDISDEGYAQIEIEGVVSIRFTTDTLDWGAGSVDSAASFATLDSNAGTVTDGSWVAESDSLILENDGSVHAIVTLDSGTVDADEFICSDDASCIATGYQEINYMVVNSEVGSCTAPVPSTFTAIPIATSEATICPDLDADDGSDTLAIDVELVIPKAAPATGGISTLTLYLEATAV